MNNPTVICIICGAKRSCYGDANPARPHTVQRDMRKECARGIDDWGDRPCSFLTLGATEANEYLRRMALREDPRIEEAAE